MSAPKATDRLYLSQVDVKTATPGVYKRGDTYRVLTRPDGKRKVMRRFDTYEEAVRFKDSTPSVPREPATSANSRRRNRRRARAVQPLEVTETVDQYKALLKADPCAYCGEPSQATDHIVPAALGGPEHWDNFTAACIVCNSRKRTKSLLLFLAYENGCWQQIAARTEAPS